jgi:hypothetical protein
MWSPDITRSNLKLRGPSCLKTGVSVTCSCFAFRMAELPKGDFAGWMKYRSSQGGRSYTFWTDGCCIPLARKIFYQTVKTSTILTAILSLSAPIQLCAQTKQVAPPAHTETPQEFGARLTPLEKIEFDAATKEFDEHRYPDSLVSRRRRALTVSMPIQMTQRSRSKSRHG